MKQVQLEIPEYLSVNDWKYFNSLEHLNDNEKMVALISHLSDKEENEIKEWQPAALQQVYATLLQSLQDLQPQFYPVFELDGVLYGFTSMAKMSLGEYMDLEKLAKNPTENLEEILAILYRPITKNRFNGIKWAFKNTYKIALGEAENLFKYYEVEKYDNTERFINAEKLSKLPASLGLGALGFFLVAGSSSLISSQLSSLPMEEQMKQMKEMNQQMTSMDFGDGLVQFIIYQQLPSFQSQERSQSLTSISSGSSTGWLLNKIKTRGMNRLENKQKEAIE